MKIGEYTKDAVILAECPHCGYSWESPFLKKIGYVTCPRCYKKVIPRRSGK